MEEEYQKEQLIKEKTQIEKEKELINNIIKTSKDLDRNSCNFEYAETELIDYYIYEMKANQAKLDYLIKLAKASGISIDNIKQIRYENLEKEIG